MKPMVIIAGVACFMGLAGCAGSTGGGSIVPVAFDDVVRSVDGNAGKLRTLRGEGEIRVESPQMSQSGGFDILLSKPDSILLAVKGPFGIRLGRALLTRSSFQFHNSLQNRLYVGRATRENIQKTLNIDLTFDDLVSLFTGGGILEADRGEPDSETVQGADVVFAFRDDPYERRYVVDPRTKQVRRLIFLDERGAPMAEQSFSSFQQQSGVSLPLTIMLTQHQGRRRITLHYTAVDVNVPTGPLVFDVPTSAERVELQ